MNIINSNKNKELLWNILFEKNIFNDIPNTSLQDIKSLFEDELLNKISIIKGNDIDLVNINKEILQNLIIKINNYKIKLNQEKDSINTIEEIQKLKLEKFNKQFENQKISMTNILNPKKPSEIEFNESIDKPLSIDEMNNMINLLEKNRNIEVDTCMNIIKKEIEDEKKTIDINNNDEYTVPKLKINNIENFINDLNIIDIADNNSKKFINEEYNMEKRFNENLISDKIGNKNKLNETIILNKINNINEQLDNVLKNQITIMNYLNID